MRDDIKKPLKAAPSRLCLREFGGTLTIDEFRKNSTTGIKQNTYDTEHVNTAKNIPSNKITTTQDENRRMNDIMQSTVTSQDNSIKLKREKPLRRELKNNLEKSLGLTIKKPPHN